MTDAGFDQISRVERQCAGHPQGWFKGRKAAALLLHESCIHADRSAKSTGGVGAMNSRPRDDAVTGKES